MSPKPSPLLGLGAAGRKLLFKYQPTHSLPEGLVEKVVKAEITKNTVSEIAGKTKNINLSLSGLAPLETQILKGLQSLDGVDYIVFKVPNVCYGEAAAVTMLVTLHVDILNRERDVWELSPCSLGWWYRDKGLAPATCLIGIRGPTWLDI